MRREVSALTSSVTVTGCVVAEDNLITYAIEPACSSVCCKMASIDTLGMTEGTDVLEALFTGSTTEEDAAELPVRVPD